MKKLLLLFFVSALCIISCSTNQFILKSTTEDLSKIKSIYVIDNKYSNVIPAAACPPYRYINNVVITKSTAFANIANLISINLKQKDIDCNIVAYKFEVEKDAYYIIYKDYWAWDFKMYLHILEIGLYKNGIEIKSVYSQGNTFGLHKYPNPPEQIPLLLDLLLKDKTI